MVLSLSIQGARSDFIFFDPNMGTLFFTIFRD